MGFEDRKNPPYRPGFSFPGQPEGPASEMREPSELIGETRFVPMDVFESDAALVAELDLPGVLITDLNAATLDSWLVIEGTKKDAADVRERAEFLCSERSFGPFKRVFKLPMAVDMDGASAIYRRGVLSVTLPKLTDRRRRARKITVTRAED